MPCATLKTSQNLPRVCIHAKLTAPSWLGLGPEAKCWSSALKAQKACGAKSSAFQSATVDDRTLRASAGPQRLWLQGFSQDLRPGKGQHPTSFSAPTPQMRRIRLPTLLPMVSGSDCANYAKRYKTMFERSSLRRQLAEEQMQGLRQSISSPNSQQKPLDILGPSRWTLRTSKSSAGKDAGDCKVSNEPTLTS